jgi:hypothetical protein
MDMGSSTMAVATTATSPATAASSTSISMSNDMSSSCQISVRVHVIRAPCIINPRMQMLWNWYTIDACFTSSTWHITSPGMFAGSCIGVILRVMSLEFICRVSKGYDQYLIRQHRRPSPSTVSCNPSAPAEHAKGKDPLSAASSHIALANNGTPSLFRPISLSKQSEPCFICYYLQWHTLLCCWLCTSTDMSLSVS